MIRAIHSEWLKYKRTPILWLVIIPPILVVLISTYYASLEPVDSNTWIKIFNITGQVWSGVWIPFGWGLISGLAANIENSSGKWRGLRVRDRAPGILYGSKLLVLVMQTFFSTLILIVMMYLSGQILGIPHGFPLQEFIFAIGVGWIAGLPLLFVSLWLAESFGWAISTGFGAIGILIASIIGGTTVGGGIWTYVPWSWPMRLTYIAHGLVTKNLPSSFSVIVFWFVLLVTVVLCVIIGSASIQWFQRREIK